MELSDVLKTRRKELGLTLAEVASRVGVTEATVQRWESGNIKNLRQERISALAEALHTTPAHLMGWETDRKTPAQLEAEDAAILEAYRNATPEIRQAIQRILER